ncbi:hypothetical protein [Nannocystis pusilla]|uniref:hypothetical protein n=1 Tax=Nannocystis pusilla TaxID=889268 RepID=UPI003B81EE06
MIAAPPRPLSWLGALLLALPHVANAAPSVSIEIEDEDDAPAPTPSPTAQPPKSTTPTTTSPTTATPPKSTTTTSPTPPKTSPAPSSAPSTTTAPVATDVDAVPVDEPVVESQPSSPPQPDPELALLREQLAAVQARLDTVEKERAAEKVEEKTAKQRTPFVRVGDVGRAEIAPTHIGFGPGAGVSQWGVRLSGYIQSQYQWSQLSEDQIQQGERRSTRTASWSAAAACGSAATGSGPPSISNSTAAPPAARSSASARPTPASSGATPTPPGRPT